MKKKILPVAWVLSVLILGVLASVLSGESTHFFGITDDQEQTISFELPVEIVRTLVVEGEEVKQGDLLMEVRRENLNSDLAIIDDELQELKSRHIEETATLKSQLISLKGKQQAQRVDMDGQIKNLQSRYELNKSFLQQLTASDEKLKSKKIKLSPLQDEIASLKTQRRHLLESSQAEIDNIQSQLDTSQRPIDGKIAALEDKKSALLRQVSNLQIRANFSGRVGSLLYKAGETVSPYQPILTVHSAYPSYVKAYINENVVNKVKLGQKVWVQSTTSTSETIVISGLVESLGSRIVEYPERLKKNKFVSAWGREVVVHLDESNELLLGEKVIVQVNKPGSMLATLLTSSDVVADVVSRGIAATEIDGVPVYSKNETSFILSTTGSVDAKGVEASGILRDTSHAGYFMIGDEGKEGKAELYRMDYSGKIIAKQIIKTDSYTGGHTGNNKMPKIDDLESISRDGKYIYLASSLSYNKHNELKAKRRQLVRLEKIGDDVFYRGSVDLYAYLDEFSKSGESHSKSNNKSRKFLQNAIESHSMDVEAHSVYKGDLYLAFKAPLNTNGESVIFKFESIDKIFSGEKTQGAIWQSLSLKDRANGEATLISDMLLDGNRLLLLSVNGSRHHTASYLWALDLADKKLNMLAVFEDLKAEGITHSSVEENSHIIVFDEGSKSVSRQLVVNTEKLTVAGSM